MKRKIKVWMLIIIAIIAINTISFADVGSFDRYDSDWGSSSWDTGYSSSSDGDFGFILGLLLGNTPGRIILGIIIISFIISSMKHKPNNMNSNIRRTPVVDVSRTHIYEDKIKQIDPNFSEEKMLAFAKELFVKLQNAWTAREWEPMRNFETESLFEQHKNQVQEYINTNRINVMDRISVNYATLYNFRQEGDRDILDIALKSTMKDYIIDATTKELLEGSKTQDRTTVYKMTFERKTGILTPEGTEEIKTTNCPNCGAPTQITSAGKCDYCGSVITTGANTWVLSNLEPLRN